MYEPVGSFSPNGSYILNPFRLLQRRKRRRAQHGVHDAAYDGSVLLTLIEDAGSFWILAELTKLLGTLLIAFPGQHVNKLVVVATDERRPVAHLAEPVLRKAV